MVEATGDGGGGVGVNAGGGGGAGAGNHGCPNRVSSWRDGDGAGGVSNRRGSRGGDCGTGGGIALAKSTSAKVRPSLRLESTGGSPPVGSVSFAFVRGRGGGDDSSSSTSSSSVGNVATAT